MLESNKSHSDAFLVNKYINGDEYCLEILINRHKQRIFNFIYSKVKDREISEDLFQDTFIKVIRTLKCGKYNEEGKFVPWVMRIANNITIDYFRKLNRLPKFNAADDFDIFSVLFDDDLNVENRLIKDHINSELFVLVEELPEDQKEVLKMRIFMDMSFNEIAENTNVSINTSLGRMRYALINLRKIIEKRKIILTI